MKSDGAVTVSCFIVRTAFNEVPVSEEVSIGAEAVFRCQHPSADTIRWRVNSTLIGRNSPPDVIRGTILDEDNTLVDTLTIVVRVRYNGTVVECVARFDDGTPEEQTEPAVLLGTYKHCTIKISLSSN